MYTDVHRSSSSPNARIVLGSMVLKFKTALNVCLVSPSCSKVITKFVQVFVRGTSTQSKSPLVGSEETLYSEALCIHRKVSLKLCPCAKLAARMTTESAVCFIGSPSWLRNWKFRIFVPHD